MRRVPATRFPAIGLHHLFDPRWHGLANYVRHDVFVASVLQELLQPVLRFMAVPRESVCLSKQGA